MLNPLFEATANETTSFARLRPGGGRDPFNPSGTDAVETGAVEAGAVAAGEPEARFATLVDGPETGGPGSGGRGANGRAAGDAAAMAGGPVRKAQAQKDGGPVADDTPAAQTPDTPSVSADTGGAVVGVAPVLADVSPEPSGGRVGVPEPARDGGVPDPIRDSAPEVDAAPPPQDAPPPQGAPRRLSTVDAVRAPDRQAVARRSGPLQMAPTVASGVPEPVAPVADAGAASDGHATTALSARSDGEATTVQPEAKRSGARQRVASAALAAGREASAPTVLASPTSPTAPAAPAAPAAPTVPVMSAADGPSPGPMATASPPQVGLSAPASAADGAAMAVATQPAAASLRSKAERASVSDRLSAETGEGGGAKHRMVTLAGTTPASIPPSAPAPAPLAVPPDAAVPGATAAATAGDANVRLPAGAPATRPEPDVLAMAGLDTAPPSPKPDAPAPMRFEPAFVGMAPPAAMSAVTAAPPTDTARGKERSAAPAMAAGDPSIPVDRVAGPAATAASAARPSAAEPSTVPSVREIPVHIAKSVRDGHADLTLALRPPELGHLTIRLHFADGHLQVDVRADRPETLHLLQREADHFERSLRQAGLDVRDGGLQFSAQGDGGRQRPTGGGGAGWQGNWALSADGHPDSNANASGRAGGSPPLSVWLAGDDRLDLRL